VLSIIIKLLGYTPLLATIYRRIKRFEKQESVERKIGFGQKCAISSSKARAVLKKQTAGRSAKSYRELGWKIQLSASQHYKKVFLLCGVHKRYVGTIRSEKIEYVPKEEYLQANLT
jgi:hypothetical protein